MRNFATALFVMALLFVANPAQATVPMPIEADQQVVLSVDNMVCVSCEMRIEEALGAVNGVASVNADAESKTVRVSFDSQRTNIRAIVAASTEAGHPAEVVTGR